MSEMTQFLLGFGLNTLAALAIVRFIYYPTNHNRAYVFTFLALTTVLFFVLSLMTSIEIGVGVGFGLFAVFSIMRYRTDTIPIREMTYMFILAALPVMNAVGAINQIWPQLIVANAAIIAVLLVLERGWGFRFEASKDVVYEKIELIQPEHRAALLADLCQRTGLNVKRVVVGKLDFVRDTAQLRVYYDPPQHNPLWQGAELAAANGGRADNDDD